VRSEIAEDSQTADRVDRLLADTPLAARKNREAADAHPVDSLWILDRWRAEGDSS
jgi:hypothetical protein